jgi:hypothetical protein
MEAPVLDRASSIAEVIHPGERVIWVGQPGGGVRMPPARKLIVIAVGLGYIVETLVSHWAGPLSALNKIELFASGGFMMAPHLLLGRENRKTTYVVTNQRLLMAVGPDRGQICEVTLAALGPMRIYYEQGYGNALHFSKRGPEAAAPVWTFLDSGKPYKWYAPWTVNDPEAVRQLIQTASNQYWLGSREKA